MSPETVKERVYRATGILLTDEQATGIRDAVLRSTLPFDHALDQLAALLQDDKRASDMADAIREFAAGMDSHG